MTATAEEVAQFLLTTHTQRLARQINGEVGVSTKAGKIHILSNDYIVQVAYPQDWLRAFGEAIALGRYYPDRHKVVYVLTGPDDQNIPMMSEHCRRSDISLWYGLI